MPRVRNRDLVDKNEEYHVGLPAGLQKLSVQLRPESDGTEHLLRVAYARGGTKRSDYFTVRAGGTYWEDNIGFFDRGLDLYLRCPEADGQEAEILTWP